MLENVNELVERLNIDGMSLKELVYNLNSRGNEYLGLKLTGDNPSNRKVYLVLSDIHIPFELENLNEYVSKFEGYVDALIIGGDYLDLHAVSTFVKDKHISLEYEIVKGYEYLEKWSKMFPQIYMIVGNHENRIQKHFNKNLNTDTLFLLPEHEKNMCLRKYEEGFTIESYGGDKKEYKPIKNLKVYHDWYMKIGDSIVSHPTSFSKVNGKTLMGTYEYFKAQGEDIRCVIIGHTHKVTKINPNNNSVCLEIGCNCKEMGYAKSGKIGYRPQVNALAVLVLDDDKVNTSLTKYHLIKDL